MNNFKQRVKITSLFLLLFSVVFIPFLYIEYHNSHMLNEIVIFPVQAANLNDKSEITQNYNIWEHIGMINKSVVVKTFVSEELKKDILTNEAKTELLHIVEEQLTMIYKHNSLPALSFSDVAHSLIFKETYMDASSSGDSYIDVLNSGLSISVWAVYAEYQDFYVYSYMDVETSALYDITILFKNTDFLYPSGISAGGFLEYLETFSDIPDEHEEVFSANGDYMERKISLYLTSVNKRTKQITSYRFNSFVINTDVIYDISPSDSKKIFKK